MTPSIDLDELRARHERQMIKHQKWMKRRNQRFGLLISLLAAFVLYALYVLFAAQEPPNVHAQVLHVVVIYSVLLAGMAVVLVSTHKKLERTIQLSKQLIELLKQVTELR